MKILLAYIAFSLCFAAAVPMATAEDDVWDLFAAAESHLLSRINAVRMNPAVVMAEAGIDLDAAVAAFPEGASWMAGGMPALALDDRLQASARGHVMDMLTRNFYGHEGTDGSTYEERIEASGYEAVEMGESVGFIAFYNYIDPTAAAEAIFQNILKNETDPASPAPKNILNPSMREVGIGILSGQITLDGNRYNAYMATCDFGSSISENITARGAESTLLILINQARMRPLDVAASLGVDTEGVRAADPERYARWAAGMAPVTKNAQLTDAAEGHAREMAVHGYVSHEDRTGRGAAERILDAGYDVDAPTGERLAFNIMDGSVTLLSDQVQQIFEEMMRAEFAASSAEETVLNPAYREAGIGLAFGNLPVDGRTAPSLVLALNFGGSTAAPPSAEGWVYRDINGDGLYSMGEGVFGASVNIVGYERIPGDWIPFAVPYEVITTDGAGRFTRPDVPKMLEIQVDSEVRIIGNLATEYRRMVFEAADAGL